MFFEFRQNNSGGSFNFNEEAGITRCVVVEAKSAEQANKLAEDIGLYWDGCATGSDCRCCGGRWYSTYNDKGSSEPEHYGQPVAQAESWAVWMPPGKEIAVHYEDGRIEWFGVSKIKTA